MRCFCSPVLFSLFEFCVICDSYKWLSPLLYSCRVMHLRCLIRKSFARHYLVLELFTISMYFMHCNKHGVVFFFETITTLNQLPDREKNHWRIWEELTRWTGKLLSIDRNHHASSINHGKHQNVHMSRRTRLFWKRSIIELNSWLIHIGDHSSECGNDTGHGCLTAAQSVTIYF